jgi:hypothetical protein
VISAARDLGDRELAQLGQRNGQRLGSMREQAVVRLCDVLRCLSEGAQRSATRTKRPPDSELAPVAQRERDRGARCDLDDARVLQPSDLRDCVRPPEHSARHRGAPCPACSRAPRCSHRPASSVARGLCELGVVVYLSVCSTDAPPASLMPQDQTCAPSCTRSRKARDDRAHLALFIDREPVHPSARHRLDPSHANVPHRPPGALEPSQPQARLTERPVAPDLHLPFVARRQRWPR